MARELTEQQRAFAVEFAKSGNATSAARSAGYSERTANEQGCRLVRRPLVAAEIARLRAKIEKKSALSVEKVMSATNALLDFDPSECFDDAGNIKPIKQIPLEARRAIQSYEKDKIKFATRLGVIELSAKLLGMLKVEQNTTVPVQIIVAPSAVSERVVTAEPSKILPDWG